MGTSFGGSVVRFKDLEEKINIIFMVDILILVSTNHPYLLNLAPEF